MRECPEWHCTAQLPRSFQPAHVCPPQLAQSGLPLTRQPRKNGLSASRGTTLLCPSSQQAVAYGCNIRARPCTFLVYQRPRASWSFVDCKVTYPCRSSHILGVCCTCWILARLQANSMHPALLTAIPMVAGLAAVGLAAYMLLQRIEERPHSQYEHVFIPGKEARVPGANNGFLRTLMEDAEVRFRRLQQLHPGTERSTRLQDFRAQYHPSRHGPELQTEFRAVYDFIGSLIEPLLQEDRTVSHL